MAPSPNDDRIRAKKNTQQKRKVVQRQVRGRKSTATRSTSRRGSIKSQTRTGHTREPDPKHNALKHTTTRKTATHERNPDAPHVDSLTRTHTHTPPATLPQPPPRASAPARGTIACAISTDFSASASARCLPWLLHPPNLVKLVAIISLRAGTRCWPGASSNNGSSPAWVPLSGACANTEAAHAGADEGDEWDAAAALVVRSRPAGRVEHPRLVSDVWRGSGAENRCR